MKRRILIFTLLICTVSVSMPVNAASKAGGYCCLDDKSWKCMGKGITPADYCEQFKRSNKETGYVELKVRENGKMRLEGKDYVMQDGDICHFRFNV